MQELIATGKTVEEAVESACRELGKSRDEVTYEILEEPRKFLFFSSPAKVKVTVLEELFSVRDLLNGSFDSGKKEEAPKQKDNRGPKEQSKKKEQQKQKDKKVQKEQPKPKEQPQKEKPAEVPAAEKAAEIKEEKPKEYIDLDKLPEGAKAALEYLKVIADKLGAGDSEYRAVKIKDGVLFEIEGENAPALIGRRGETMDAIQYLCLLVSNRAGEEYCRISIDVVGYRSRREKALRELAEKTGKEVLKTKYSQTLEPMNPYERRIIHSTIQGIEGVKSESVGYDPNRRVVVSLISGGINRSQKGRGGRGKGRKNGGSGYRRDRQQPREDRSAETASEEVRTREPEVLPEAEGMLYGKIDI